MRKASGGGRKAPAPARVRVDKAGLTPILSRDAVEFGAASNEFSVSDRAFMRRTVANVRDLLEPLTRLLDGQDHDE